MAEATISAAVYLAGVRARSQLAQLLQSDFAGYVADRNVTQTHRGVLHAMRLVAWQQ